MDSEIEHLSEKIKSNSQEFNEYIKISLESPNSFMNLKSTQNDDGVFRVPSLLFPRPVNNSSLTNSFRKLSSGIFINEKCTVQFQNVTQMQFPITIPKNTPLNIRNLIERTIISQQNKYSSKFFYKFDTTTSYQLNKLQLDLNATSTIFGSFNRNDDIFSSFDCNKFSHYCAIIAFVYSILIPVANAWNSRFIDDIMITAYELLKQGRTVEFVLPVNLGKFLNFHIIFKQSDPIISGILNSDQNNVLNVMQGLYMFFQKYDAGLLISGDVHLMIWHHNNGFLVFDTLGRSSNLQRQDTYGRSCLIQTTLVNIAALVLSASRLDSYVHYTILEISLIQAEYVSDEMVEYLNQKLDGVIEDVYSIDDVEDSIVVPPHIKQSSLTLKSNPDNLSNLSEMNVNEEQFKTQEVVNVIFDNFITQITSNDLVEASELGEIKEAQKMMYSKEILCKIINDAVDFSENLYKCEIKCFCFDRKCKLNSKSNFVDFKFYTILPNKTFVLFSSSTKLPDVKDSFFIIMAAIAVSYKHKQLSSWNVLLLDYIIKTAFIIQSNISSLVIENKEEIRRITLPIDLGMVSNKINAIYFLKIYRSELEKFIQRFFRQKQNYFLFLSKYYSFIVFKQHEEFFLFDGLKYNLFGLIQREDSKNYRYCILKFLNLQSLVNRLLIHINPDDFINVYSIVIENNFNLEEINNYKPQLTPIHNFAISDLDYLYKIQGSLLLEKRFLITENYIKECYFTSIFVILFLIRLPVYKWSDKVIDLAIENGINLFKINAENDGNRLFKQREINNILIDGFSFNIFVHEKFSSNNRINLLENIRFYFKERQFLILQFCNVSFVIYKDGEQGQFHLFDCYSCEEVSIGDEPLKMNIGKVEMVEDRRTASWILYQNLESLIEYVKQRVANDEIFTGYKFHSINVTSYSKTRDKIGISLPSSPFLTVKHSPFNFESDIISEIPLEDKKWLHHCGIPPWSRLLSHHIIQKFKKIENVNQNVYISQHDLGFQIIYHHDLFVMWGKIHPRHQSFGKNRGKQYYGIAIIACAMAKIYNFQYWSPDLIDQIVIEGDRLFNDSCQSIKIVDYQIDLDDMKTSFKIESLGVKYRVKPFRNGYLFSAKNNLAHVILNFFQDGNEHGLIQCNARVVSFGIDKRHGYYIFDAQTMGFPIFENTSDECAYVIRCMSLKRLLFCLVIILMMQSNVMTDDQNEFVIYAFDFDFNVGDMEVFKTVKVEHVDQTMIPARQMNVMVEKKKLINYCTLL